MGIIEKQSIRNLILTYLGVGLGFISTLYLFPSILTTEEYGLTRILLSIAFLTSEFTHLGIKNIAIKFFPEFENYKTNHNGLLFLLLAVPLVGYLLFLILFFIFDDWLITKYSVDSNMFGEFHLFLLPLVFGILYFDVINSYVRANNDSIPGTFVNEVLLRVLLIIMLILMNFEVIDFELFIVGFVSCYLVQPTLLLMYVASKKLLFIKPNFKFLSKKLVRRLGSYGFYVMLGGMSHLVVNNIDILMLGSISGLTDTAIYTIAFYIGSVIVVPQKSIGKIAPSIISKHIFNSNIGEVERIYKSSSINQLVLGFLLFTGIVSNIHNIFEILPQEYKGAFWVIIYIGVSKLIDMAGGVNGIIIMNSPYYRFNLIATLFLIIISILLILFLIPKYGITGAAIATMTSLFIYNFAKGLYVYKKYRIQPLSLKIIPVIVVSVLLIIISFQIDTILGTYIDITIRSFLILILYGLIMVYFKISPEVENYWSKVLKFVNF